MKIFSFPPVCSQDSKVLILGTMPGKKSLSENEYYAHNGNQFWKIIFDLFQETFTNIYETKIRLLDTHNVALWDVLKVCNRESSADIDILLERPNNIGEFLNEHKKIKTIFFNGKKAAEYFDQYFPESKLESYILPSTSPANTWLTYQQKIEKWQPIADFT